ncbi:MAG TPA: hypothetical protein VGC31_01340 [Paenirhodobacter sp.]
MTDRFASHQPGLTAPASDAFSVTPSDATDLSRTARAVYIGSAGSLSGVMVSGETVAFTGLQAGMVYPFRLRRIRATGTTAGGIVALL